MWLSIYWITTYTYRSTRSHRRFFLYRSLW